MENMKYCESCGNQIYVDAVICPKCGKQVEKISMNENNPNPQIVINNNNSNNLNAAYMKKECDKWIALILCFFLGIFGAHKFYEGKTGLGILYIFTGGLFLIGVTIDFIVILCKPNPYYV